MLLSLNYSVQRVLKTSLSFFKPVQLISTGCNLILVCMFSPLPSLWAEISPIQRHKCIFCFGQSHHICYQQCKECASVIEYLSSPNLWNNEDSMSIQGNNYFTGSLCISNSLIPWTLNWPLFLLFKVSSSTVRKAACQKRAF